VPAMGYGCTELVGSFSRVGGYGEGNGLRLTVLTVTGQLCSLLRPSPHTVVVHFVPSAVSQTLGLLSGKDMFF
jgi:hypothetical protein